MGAGLFVSAAGREHRDRLAHSSSASCLVPARALCPELTQHTLLLKTKVYNIQQLRRTERVEQVSTCSVNVTTSVGSNALEK